jgi:hypothetical protein
MIRSRSLQERDVADIANCKKCTVTEVPANIRAFGSPCIPKATGERRSRILPYVLDMLLSCFLVKPDLWNEFGLSISTDSVRTLQGPTRIRLLRYSSRTMAASWYRHLRIRKSSYGIRVLEHSSAYLKATYTVTAIQFSPDGSKLASAFLDKKPSYGIRRERDGLKLLI